MKTFSNAMCDKYPWNHPFGTTQNFPKSEHFLPRNIRSGLQMTAFRKVLRLY